MTVSLPQWSGVASDRAGTAGTRSGYEAKQTLDGCSRADRGWPAQPASTLVLRQLPRPCRIAYSAFAITAGYSSKAAFHDLGHMGA